LVIIGAVVFDVVVGILVVFDVVVFDVIVFDVIVGILVVFDVVVGILVVFDVVVCGAVVCGAVVGTFTNIFIILLQYLICANIFILVICIYNQLSFILL
jgi:hypothetical protein